MRYRYAFVAVFVVPAMLATSACSSATPSSSDRVAEGPEADRQPRVLVEGMLFDTPAGSLVDLGVNPATSSFGEMITRAGSHAVVAPTELVVDDVDMRSQGTIGEAVGDYRLVVKPHVLEHDRVRMAVDLELAGKSAKTTLVVDDKQVVVVGTEVEVGARRMVLVVRPTIVRSHADLEAVHARKLRERAEALAK